MHAKGVQNLQLFIWLIELFIKAVLFYYECDE